MTAQAPSVATDLEPNLASVLQRNLAAYETLADDYRATSRDRLAHALVSFAPPDGSRLLNPRSVRPALDIGCADGSHAVMLAERGYDVTAVDFSARMIELARARGARSTVPRTPTFLEGEFHTGKFMDVTGAVVPLRRHYDLVLANAFVHLFPRPIDGEVTRKVLDLVAPGGVALLSTTIEPTRGEDFLRKVGSDGTQVERWRGRYPEDDFVRLVRASAGAAFSITCLTTTDMRGKPWLTVFARRAEGRL